MKVSKLFHWLYASVMFIPLLIAPIFGLAVRSDNNFQPIEVTAQENKVVDFNQVYKPYNTSIAYGVDIILNNDNSQDLTGTFTGNVNDYFFIGNFYTIIKDHKYYIKKNVSIGNVKWGFGGLNSLNDNVNETLFYYNSNYGNYFFVEVLELNYTFDCHDLYIQMYDLTQMFGVGNEPTIEQFNNYFPNDYYEYTLSKKVLLKDAGTITYSDTDVGSQLVYTLYNATDKYFNFNQFLGIGDLFDWFQLNVFNGNAPLGFIIFWNLLIYWLLVSIAWLIFDIAMYVPKLAHRWLDKASLE